jgi:protein TonB
MYEPALRFRSSLSSQTPWLKRITENIESLWTLPRVALAANQAPIHLLDEHRGRGSSAAHLGSMGVHVLIFGSAILIFLSPPLRPNGKNFLGLERSSAPKLIAPNWLSEAANRPLGKHGSSGDHNPLPPTAGDLAPMSRMVLAPPRLPDERTHLLPIQVTTYEADAPEIVSPVKDIGLPWMNDLNHSAGTGKNGIGTGTNSGMGKGPGDGSGEADSLLPYARVATQVVCLHCPDPLYSDEARKAKLQGSVTLRVLVGPDGRAKEVQVTRGVGLGLDENAVHAVRGWQFSPAKDAARHPIPSWITIETTFRLF